MTPKRARKAKAARKPARKAAPKAAALIEVMVQSPRWKKQPRAAAIVRNAVAAAAKAASIRPALAIVLTDDSRIRTLNREWRGFDKPTNVLSYPSGERLPGGRTFLGDIVLARQTVWREAKAQGKRPADHVAHLVVHGTPEQCRATIDRYFANGVTTSTLAILPLDPDPGPHRLTVRCEGPVRGLDGHLPAVRGEHDRRRSVQCAGARRHGEPSPSPRVHARLGH